MEAAHPFGQISAPITRNGMAVTHHRQQAGRILFAVEIDDQAGNAGQDRGAVQLRREQLADLRHADVDRDMFAKQRRIDAQIDIVGDMGRGMIDDDQQVEIALAHGGEGFTHDVLILVSITHQSG